MVDPDFVVELNARHMAWRRVVTLAMASGIPSPALAASLNYLDTYRRASLPANLTQVVLQLHTLALTYVLVNIISHAECRIQ
jgi:6-phosphogluconate dehydrogenase